jgi:septal ring factor EnvC (AmiA/AmiB activator)
MRKRRRQKRAVGIGIVLVLAALPLLSGCGPRMAKQEQLAMLEEARKAAESSQAELNACRQKQSELEKTLAQKKQKLAKFQNDRDIVQSALNQQ